MDEMINKYELQRPFQNNDAGFSRWTIATKGFKKFFLKELMDPKYPEEESLRESLRTTRIKECERFEEEKSRLYAAINDASDGNLVRIIEFFRADSRYYVSTGWIEQAQMSFRDLSALDLKDKLILCRAAAHSLAGLHEKRIVHADIKDTNVLIHKTKEGGLVTKIIDFGSSFFEGSPPENEDELGGDQVYLSPEACLFIYGEDVELTCKMDVFALGLLFHQFFTGELPYFDNSTYDYAHEAVLEGVVLKADSADIPLPVREIIEHMLLKEASERISMKEVYSLLTAYYEKAYPVSRPIKISDEPDGNVGSPSKLRMSKDFFKKAGEL